MNCFARKTRFERITIIVMNVDDNEIPVRDYIGFSTGVEFNKCNFWEVDRINKI